MALFLVDLASLWRGSRNCATRSFRSAERRRTPELVFEVASPSTVRHDEGVKCRRYEREGVRHYVVVFAEERRARAMRLDGRRFVEMPDALAAPLSFDRLGCPFSLDLTTLLGELRF